MRLQFILSAILALSTLTAAADRTTTIVVTTSDFPYTQQGWWYLGEGNAFNNEKLKTYWNDDYYVTSAAYTSHGWFFTASKGTGWTNQGYRIDDVWPTDWLQEKWNDGYYITSLAASDDQYFVMASEGTNITSQKLCSNPNWSVIRDWLHEWWNQGYLVTGMCCKNGLWTFLMSYTGEDYLQKVMWANSADEISDKIKEAWNDNYIITALEYGGGEFCVVMSMPPGSAAMTQGRFIRYSDSPKEYIQEHWDKNENITYIGG